MSMYETGSGLKPYLPKGETPYPEEGIPTLQPFPPHVSKTCSLLSFAVSSPLPCFHHCPSCLHPVCKPFFLPFSFFSHRFPPSLATVGSSCSIKDSHKKQKITQCHGLRYNQSHLILSRYFSNYSPHTCCLLGCCLFVRQSSLCTEGDAVILIYFEGLYCVLC